MSQTTLHTTTLPATRPVAHRWLYPSLFPVPVTCFVGALITDIVYWQQPSIQWANFSVWLITFGLIASAFAVLAGLIDLLRGRRDHTARPAWGHLLGGLLAVALSVLNAFVHSRDAYTSVVPSGLILSASVVLILLIASLDRPSRAGRTDRAAGIVMALCLVVFLAAVGAAVALTGTPNTSLSPSAQYGGNPVLPAPHQYFMPPMHIAPIDPWNQNTPTVPQGMQVHALATGLAHPRQIYPLPNGDVLVVESGGPQPPINRPKDLIMGWVEATAGARAKAGNRITLLRDTNGDGVVRLRTIFLDHLNSPFGVALVGHDLYVADTDAIMHYTYTDGATAITEAGTKLTDLPGGPIDHHWTKSLVASPDGTKLYVGIGSNSNITENGLAVETGRADVWEVDRATGAHRIYASGLRNPTGLQFEPQSKTLWAIVNERDEIGPNLVPDYFTSVRDGAFYGWPYSYYGQHVDARVMPQRPDLVASAIPPDYALSSHVAPLGLTFYTGGSLPAAYNGGAFVGEHGSWDRNPLNGYKVVFIPFANGHPTGPPQDVVTGFLSSANHARGRPVGIAIDHAGALLIADDLGNTVWRVTGAGPK